MPQGDGRTSIGGGGPCPGLIIASYKEPWTASLWDGLQRFSVQLASAGGSGALAKTAFAPLERVKVCPYSANDLCLEACHQA